MNYRKDEFLINFHVKPSQEVLQLDIAIQETQRIQSDLEQILRNIKRLSVKFKTPSAREYFSFFEAPDERKCENGDHLTWNYCSLINEQSHNDDSNLPQNHQQTCEEITNDDYNPTTTSSFFNKIINHNQNFMIAMENNKNNKQLSAPTSIQFHAISCMSCCNGVDSKNCPRKLSEHSKSYNIIKLQTIKIKREMERALLILERTSTLSNTRALEMNNYFVLKIVEPTVQKSSQRELHLTRRSISTASCKVKAIDSRRSLKVKRPASVF